MTTEQTAQSSMRYIGPDDRVLFVVISGIRHVSTREGRGREGNVVRS